MSCCSRRFLEAAPDVSGMGQIFTLRHRLCPCRIMLPWRDQLHAGLHLPHLYRPLHHGRGNARAPVLLLIQIVSCFSIYSQRPATAFNWLCHAYCLMDNHYHPVIETPDGNLSKGMRQLNGVYTRHSTRETRGLVMYFREGIKQ